MQISQECFVVHMWRQFTFSMIELIICKNNRYMVFGIDTHREDYLRSKQHYVLSVARAMRAYLRCDLVLVSD